MSPRIREFINRGAMPLVGRERELRSLLDAFNALLEGEPRSVWMNGTPGVGKSRLLDELKERARDHSARSLVVHAKWYEGEGVELGPLSNALDVIRPALSAPVAARIFRDGSITTVDAAVEAVQVASRRYPVVLILDDLHYLRTSSELARFVGALEEIAILLVVTARPVENPAVRSFRSALAASIPPLELEIGPLDGAGIAEAATSLFGSAPPEEMVGQIAALSAGLPLTLREVFRELMAGDHVAAGRSEEKWEWHAASLDDEAMRTIGDSVHGFSGRLASLPPAERSILVLAAYLGEQFNRDLLRHLCEKTIGWDGNAFERLILGGFVSVATPSIRLGSRDAEARVCYAFMHTLLWKAAAAIEGDEIPSRGRIASDILELLTSGIGELYTVSALEPLDASSLDEAELEKLFTWLVAVGRRISSIYSETFVSLCQTTLEPFRSTRGATGLSGDALHNYLAALTAYGERLYLCASKETLRSVATEIATILEGLASEPPVGAERVVRLEGAIVVWKNDLLQGEAGARRAFLDELLKFLPAPAEQSDRELHAAAEAIRFLASHSNRGDFADMLDFVAPYIGEMDRMRPETMSALFKVLLYAMIRADRLQEAGRMVEAGLRVRHEADLFTEYELLMHAANFADEMNDLDAIRRYATEARSLLDRYPSYRNHSMNYYHLPYVAAREGRIDELSRLEEDFRATPPPARSTAVQLFGARYRFQQGWNLLAIPDRAMRFSREIEEAATAVPPVQQMRIASERLRSCIDAGLTEELPAAIECFESILSKLGGEYIDPNSEIGKRWSILSILARSLGEEQPEALRERVASMKGEELSDVDAFRASRILLEAAERSAGRKREFNDAAYTAIELALKNPLTQASPGLAHHHLDRLSSLLPKTRLMKFRQAAGGDPRDHVDMTNGVEAHTAEASPTAPQRRILRTFGALRIEGGEDSGAKLESKTRTLVAALVVPRLGDTRWIGELTRDRLADLLWPDMSIDRAVNNLHATLSYARRFLGGADTIVQRDGVYDLGEEVLIDAAEFRENVQKGDRLHSEGIYFGAAVSYRKAIDLADGDFLEGMYAEWADNVRESLRGELATALERLIAIEIDRDNYAAIPPLAERLLGLDDLHDGAYEAMIRSAAARGARREAFTYYKRYETALDAYGAGPARRITELMARVRAGEEG